MAHESIPSLDQRKLDRGFVLRLKSLQHRIAALETGTAAERFRFGPQYRLITAAGERQALTAAADQPKNQTRLMVVMLQSPDGGVIAESLIHVKRDSQGRYIANQDLSTGLRAAQLAVPTAFVAFDLIQRYANEVGAPITIREEDAHGAYLRGIEQSLRGDVEGYIEEQLLAELDVYKNERPRWLALFGPNGKLGYDRNLEKQLLPNDRPADLLTLDTIRLAPRLSAGVPEVIEELMIQPSAQANVQSVREHQFKAALRISLEKNP